MEEYNDKGQMEVETSQCRYFGECDFEGVKTLLGCGDNFDPAYGEKCQRRKCLIQKSRGNGGGLSERVK